MGTWVLIMTVVLSAPNPGQLITVDHVEGFATYDECTEAGKKWGEMVKEAIVTIGGNIRATCVNTNGPDSPVPERKK